MAPQTRSAVKSSPGRLTRNSIYGRPPLSPAKPRKSATGNSPARAAATHHPEVESKGTLNAGDTNGTPWLACRDPYGVFTTVAVSETGEGVHIRWYYTEDDRDVDEEEEADVEMTLNEERDVTPFATAGPGSAPRRPFPQTPMPLHPYDAGSVIRTPVKKARPLKRSPTRIGDKGIRCLYEKGGVLRELNGGIRVVLRHPVGSSANLSREQVEHLEKEREDKIIEVQVKRLLEQKRRLEEEEKQFSDNGYEDEMDTDVPLLQRQGTNGTDLISHDDLPDIVAPASVQDSVIDRASGFRGPDGELLDRYGRQMLGREGTILIDSTYSSPRRIRREEAFRVSTDNFYHISLSDYASEADGSHWAADFGPEGTD